MRLVKRKKSSQITGAMLCMVMLLSIFSVTTFTAGAAKVTKEERSYDIAVVFDNSGSMYEGTDRWCKAKYAMEIFASMLDYTNGDRLTIFPMWEVTTDGTEINRELALIDVDPVEIKSLGDIQKITNLYTTVYDYGTTFKPVEEAHNYLKKSGATDKWLVVLTDGAFNALNREEYVGLISAGELQSRLLKLAGNGINIQYLGFGEASQLKSKPSKNFYTSDKELSLQDNLINICNMIFKRSELPPRYLEGKNFTADISMKKLIAFAQGNDAEIGTLISKSGSSVEPLSSSGQRKYSTVTGNGYKIGSNSMVDKSLAGQVVTFDSFEAGKYTLNFSNADKIQLFYEPDVDMSVVLDGPEGMDFDPTKGAIPAGTYKVNVGLKDSKTGTDLTGHPLLGNVDLKVKVKTSDQDKYETFQNGAEVVLNPDTGTDILIEGTYLDDYKISSEDDLNLKWLKGMNVEVPFVDFEVKADVLQKDDWYVIKDSASWQPIKVALTVNGKPLTAEQLEKTEFVAACSSQTLAYSIEKSEADSAYYIYVGRTTDGGFAEPAVGNYSFSFAGTNYTDQYGKNYEVNETANFDIQTYSKIWVKLIWVLIIGGILLALTAIFLSIMLQKVLPGNVRMDWAKLWTISAGKLDGKKFTVLKYGATRKERCLTVATKSLSNPSEVIKATFKLEPVDNRFTSSDSRLMRIVDISTNCRIVNIGGKEYVKNKDGKWVLKTAVSSASAKPISQEIGNTTIKLRKGSEYGDDSCLEFKIKRLKK